MKRPLVTVAAGFVLGEVLALRYEQAAATDFLKGWAWVLLLILGMVLAACAGLFFARRLGLCGVPIAEGMGRIFGRGEEKMQGRGAGKRALLLFFAL